MGSGTYERSGARISTGASGGYEFVRFPRGETWHDGGDPNKSDGYAELYFEIGFYVDSGNFYGANFRADGSSVDSFQVYGPNAYNVHGWTIQVPWNGYRHFWEKSSYTSYSSGYHESVVDFYWYPTLPTYTVTYSAGQGTGAPSSQTKEYGSSLKLSADVPTRTNYKFMGWTDGTNTYQPGGEYSANVNASLTAIWELDFVPPTATLEAHRTTSASSSNDDPNGVHGYASVEWACDQTKGTNNIASIVAVESNGATVTFTAPFGTSGTTVMHWPLAANSSCSLTVTVTDTNGQSTVKTVVLGTVNRAFQAVYDESNQRKYFKMSELELATPLGIAQGGTGAATALAARAALGIYMGNGEVLYDNPSHNPGDGMRLSAPYTDYDYLVVVCKDNDGAICQPTIIPNPQVGTVFNVLDIYVGASNGNFYFKATSFELVTNSGVADGIGWPKDGNNWRTGQFTINNNGNSWSYSFNIAPILVIGYKS